MEKEKKYWLAVEIFENWLTDKKIGFSLRGFRNRAQRTVKKIKPEDLMVIYIASKKSSLGGIVQVESEVYVDKSYDLIWDDFFPLRVKTKPLVILDDNNMVPFKEIIKDISFINKKEKWGNYIRQSLIEISIADFKVMEKAIKKRISK